RTQGFTYAVDAGLAPIGLLVAFAAAEHPALVVVVLPLVGLLAILAREREQRIDAALELGHAYRGTAFLLGDVVEADDAYTGEHSAMTTNRPYRKARSAAEAVAELRRCAGSHFGSKVVEALAAVVG